MLLCSLACAVIFQDFYDPLLEVEADDTDAEDDDGNDRDFFTDDEGESLKSLLTFVFRFRTADSDSDD